MVVDGIGLEMGVGKEMDVVSDESTELSDGCTMVSFIAIEEFAGSVSALSGVSSCILPSSSE